MKRIFAIVLILVFLLSGCKSDEGSGACEHKWERAENLNEYTAVEKCSKCGTARKYTDTENITNSGTESGFVLVRYNWDGYGVGRKEIMTSALGYAVIDCLSKLEETEQIIPKISDDTVDESTGELPVTCGTVWIECGSVGLFRLNPEMTEICKVQTHLGEGKVLLMTETLKELLRQAWYYYPNDCWFGEYKNGEITLEQAFKANSAVESVEIESIYVVNEPHSADNKITLRIRACDSKRVSIFLESYQSSDNLASGDAKEIELKENKWTEVELNFGGFYNHSYQLSIRIDNTVIQFTIDPRK